MPRPNRPGQFTQTGGGRLHSAAWNWLGGQFGGGVEGTPTYQEGDFAHEAAPTGYTFQPKSWLGNFFSGGTDQRLADQYNIQQQLNPINLAQQEASQEKLASFENTLRQSAIQNEIQNRLGSLGRGYSTYMTAGGRSLPSGTSPLNDVGLGEYVEAAYGKNPALSTQIPLQEENELTLAGRKPFIQSTAEATARGGLNTASFMASPEMQEAKNNALLSAAKLSDVSNRKGITTGEQDIKFAQENPELIAGSEKATLEGNIYDQAKKAGMQVVHLANGTSLMLDPSTGTYKSIEVPTDKEKTMAEAFGKPKPAISVQPIEEGAQTITQELKDPKSGKTLKVPVIIHGEPLQSGSGYKTILSNLPQRNSPINLNSTLASLVPSGEGNNQPSYATLTKAAISPKQKEVTQPTKTTTGAGTTPVTKEKDSLSPVARWLFNNFNENTMSDELERLRKALYQNWQQQ